MPPLLIDRLGQMAEERPDAPCLPGVSNAEAWSRSGAVASWLIAQGYGPGLRAFSVPAGDGSERALLILGALRAGAEVIEGPLPAKPGALLACSVDAAVAERRLHIDETTPARAGRRHGDIADLAEALA